MYQIFSEMKLRQLFSFILLVTAFFVFLKIIYITNYVSEKLPSQSNNIVVNRYNIRSKMNEDFLQRSVWSLAPILAELLDLPVRIVEVELKQFTPKISCNFELHSSNGEKMLFDGNDIVQLVPSIVHFNLPENLTSYQYISIVSAYWIHKPKYLFMWYDKIQPQGKLWDNLKKNISEFENNTIYARRCRSDRIYDKMVTRKTIKRIITKIEALLVFGGMFLDLDMVSVKSVDNLRKFPCSMGAAGGSICEKVVMGVRNSSFLQLWHLSFQMISSYNIAVNVVGKMIHRWPHLVHIEEHSFCHPTASQVQRMSNQLKTSDWSVNNFFVRIPDGNFSFAEDVFGFVQIGRKPAVHFQMKNTLENRFKYRQYSLNETFISKALWMMVPFLLQVRAGLTSEEVENLLRETTPSVDQSLMTPHTINGRLLDFAEIHEAIQDDMLVPNALHYILPFHNTKLRFHHFVCIVSGYWVLKPKKMFLWYNTMPSGKWWNQLRKNITNFENDVILMHRPILNKVYGYPVKKREHKADIVRLEALLSFGGIYLDIDVLAVSSVETLRNHPFTIGRESRVGLCNGIMLSTPNSTFAALFHLSYQVFNHKDWAYHSVILPGLMKTVYGRFVHVEEISLNQPNWKHIKLIYGAARHWNWRKYNYAVHLWYRFYDVEHDMETIKYVNSMFGDIFRQTLFGDSRLNLGQPLPYRLYKYNTTFLKNARENILIILKKFDLPVPSNVNFWNTIPSTVFEKTEVQLYARRKKIGIESFASSVYNLKTETEIPDILHYSLHSTTMTGELKFHEMVAISSGYQAFKPKKLFIWCDVKPHGIWWKHLMKNISNTEDKVVVAFKTIGQLYGTRMPAGPWKSDIIRLQILLHFGGIFIDIHVVTLRKPVFLRTTILSQKSNQFSNQIIASPPYDPFISLWHLTLQVFQKEKMEVFFNKIPYLIAQTWPDLVHDGGKCDGTYFFCFKLFDRIAQTYGWHSLKMDQSSRARVFKKVLFGK